MIRFDSQSEKGELEKVVPLLESVKAVAMEADVEPALIPQRLKKRRGRGRIPAMSGLGIIARRRGITHLIRSAKASLLGMTRSSFFLSLSVRPNET